MNMQNMMKQAQKLQKQMEQKQADLAAMEFVGKSAQDLVMATFTGEFYNSRFFSFILLIFVY